MMTWIQLWPLLGVPSVLVAALAAMPTAAFNNRIFGGGPIREGLLNHLLLPVLPNDLGVACINWFAHASVFNEWLLAVLIGLNLNALLLPLLYGLGVLLIQMQSWLMRKDLDLKRQQARR